MFPLTTETEAPNCALLMLPVFFVSFFAMSMNLSHVQLLSSQSTGGYGIPASSKSSWL